MHPRYTFPCDPKYYVNGALEGKVHGPLDSRYLPEFPAQPDTTYYIVAGYCGVDNSFLPSSIFKGDVTKKSLFDSYRRPHIIFSPNDWANHPDVAVWAEAWQHNAFRRVDWDVHLALYHVKP
jgi:hypothetical protein